MGKAKLMNATKFTYEFTFSSFVKAECYVTFKIVALSFGERHNAAEYGDN
jgi:hypothetical protein